MRLFSLWGGGVLMALSLIWPHSSGPSLSRVQP